MGDKKTDVDTIVDRSPFSDFSFYLGERFLSKLFTKTLDCETLLKLFDVVLLVGFDFVHKFD